jgi:hypothetical protein
VQRPLNQNELKAIGKILDENFSGRNDIVDQIGHATVSQVDDVGNSISIYLHTKDTNPAPTTERVPVIAKTKDGSGALITLELHIVEGKVHMLDII